MVATGGTLTAFDMLVENHEGTRPDVDFGGGRTKPRKLTAKEHWLRAAFCVLWVEQPEDRDQLIQSAIKLGVGTNRKSLTKMVDNVDQGKLRYDEAYKPLVQELYAAGWTTLKDFCRSDSRDNYDFGA